MNQPMALQVRNLSRSYGKRRVVSSLEINVEAGDVYGFLGPNGSGKTTAMRCVMGLIRPDSGEVFFFGEQGAAARRHVGAIIETPCFHNWMSGRANLEQSAAFTGLTRGERDRELDRVLERVGLKDRAKDKAAGYSLGMRQRLGIARALLGKPKLLVLDEPTNGLDPAGMREMRDLIRSLALHDNLTVFISSHLLAEVEAICNRVGILKEGHLKAEGRVSELLVGAAEKGWYEFGTEAGESLAEALAALDGVTVQGPGKAGRLRVKLEGVEISSVVRELVSNGLPITSVIPLERTLEEIFLELTQ